MKKFFPNLVYLLLAMPLGILYFVILVTGYALGAGLIITLIGIPILVTMGESTPLLYRVRVELTFRPHNPLSQAYCIFPCMPG